MLLVEAVFGVHPWRLSVVFTGYAAPVVVPVALHVCLALPTCRYGALGLAVGAGARRCVLCRGITAGRCRLLCVVLPVLRLCADTDGAHSL